MQRVVNIRYYKILVVADQYYTQLIPAVNQDVIHSKTTKQIHKKEQRATNWLSERGGAACNYLVIVTWRSYVQYTCIRHVEELRAINLY